MKNCPMNAQNEQTVSLHKKATKSFKWIRKKIDNVHGTAHISAKTLENLTSLCVETIEP